MEMDGTHKFKLPSGVEALIKPMTGKHQRLLSQPNGLEDNLKEILKDRTVRIGSVDSITTDFINSMLSVDKNAMFVELRNISFFLPDAEKTVTVNYEYKSKQTNRIEEYTHKEILPKEGFPVKGLKSTSNEGKSWEPVTYSEYEDIILEYTVRLPVTKKEVTFMLLSNKGENYINNRRKKLDSHTQIEAAFPREQRKQGDKVIPISLNLDNLPVMDTEFLRKCIAEANGELGTTIRFEHPEADLLASGERIVSVNAISQPSFFFPSGAMG